MGSALGGLRDGRKATGTACQGICNIQGSQRQIVVLAFRSKSLNPCMVFPFRSTGEVRAGSARRWLQGYLAHKKHPLRRTL